MPHFGLPAEGKRRWCSGCAKGHAGAVDVNSKKCEGCGVKAPSLGLPAEGKKRWCAGCANQIGVVGVAKRKAADKKAAPKKHKAADKKAAPKKK